MRTLARIVKEASLPALAVSSPWPSASQLLVSISAAVMRATYGEPCACWLPIMTETLYMPEM